MFDLCARQRFLDGICEEEKMGKDHLEVLHCSQLIEDLLRMMAC